MRKQTKLRYLKEEEAVENPEEMLLFRGKIQHRKRPNRMKFQNNKISTISSLLSFGGNTETTTKSIKKSCRQEIKQSKGKAYDILKYLKIKCPNPYVTTLNNFLSYQLKESHTEKIGVGIRMAPILQRQSNTSVKHFNNLYGIKTQVLSNKSCKDILFPFSFSKSLYSVSPIKKTKMQRKKTLPTTTILRSMKQLKQQQPPKSIEQKPSKKIIRRDFPNKQKPLFIYNHQQLSNITSQKFTLIDANSSQIILTNNGRQKVQIASLTKIMTALLILNISERNSIDIKSKRVVINTEAVKQKGTSANLCQGDLCTLQQLLFGLLLPSGNDAAIVLADWGGSILNGLAYNIDHKQNIITFVQEMNKVAKQLGLKDTRYANPHGLISIDGKSTAYDQCKLAAICMKNEIFKIIVKTKSFSCHLKNALGIKRLITWQNTNKLLQKQGFIGLKTGITSAAGPCLISAYQFKQNLYILTILNCKKPSSRFVDSSIIINWALSKVHCNFLTLPQLHQLSNLLSTRLNVLQNQNEQQSSKQQ